MHRLLKEAQPNSCGVTDGVRGANRLAWQAKCKNRVPA